MFAIHLYYFPKYCQDLFTFGSCAKIVNAAMGFLRPTLINGFSLRIFRFTVVLLSLKAIIIQYTRY